MPGCRAPALSVCLLVLAVLAPAAVAAGNLADLVARVRPSIVGIGTYLPTRRPPANLEGSGFAIGDGSLIVTNDHVIARVLDDKLRERHVVFVGRGRQPELRDVSIVARDEVHDLAILRISGAPLPALALAADGFVREGDDIAFTGFPIGAVLGLYPATHRGIVAAITPIVIPARQARDLSMAQVAALRDPYDVLQLDAIAYPGNSGSPVYLRESGEVVGVISQVLVKGRKENVLSDPSGITYAIPVRFVREMMPR